MTAESKYGSREFRISSGEVLDDLKKNGGDEYRFHTSRWKGETVMTKAKARARAKARAVAKAANPKAKSAKPEAKVPPGRFDAKSSAIRNIGGGANIKSAAGMRRGGARGR